DRADTLVTSDTTKPRPSSRSRSEARPPPVLSPQVSLASSMTIPTTRPRLLFLRPPPPPPQVKPQPRLLLRLPPAQPRLPPPLPLVLLPNPLSSVRSRLLRTVPVQRTPLWLKPGSRPWSTSWLPIRVSPLTT
ncbi:hypothetical protein BGZ88_005435, partial [Linnemannia elongata]